MQTEVVVNKSSMWMSAGLFIILVRDKETNSGIVPIFIHPLEYERICFILEDTETTRPLTHDLFKNTLVEWGIMINKVVLTKLENETYFAEIHSVRDGKEKIIDGRPSDAIALALCYGSPIFMEESFLAQMINNEDTRKFIELLEQGTAS